jgi:LacI family transcriptional regulator
MNSGSPSYRLKLAGIRRYCAARGWEAVAIERADSTPEALPEILRRHSPVGCIVDGTGRHPDLPPRLFRGTPVTYVGYPSDIAGSRPNFRFDTDAIVQTAFRELSTGMPSCYAAVGFPNPPIWSHRRVRAFRNAVRSSGAQCFVFSAKSHVARESWEAFVARLAPWLAKLPEHCAVFAVSDETAALVTRAAAAARRPIPWSLTLLSVDNFADICESASPPISSIQLDFEHMGFIAARSLDGPWGDAESIAPVGPLLTVRRKSTSGRGRHEKFILDAVEAIRREACDGLSAAALIGRYPVSKRLFTLRFREATGHSVLDEILHVRLEKAFTLLSQTNTAIGAIPRLCGFNCDRTLDALFRSRFGMSMRAWRKKNAR